LLKKVKKTIWDNTYDYIPTGILILRIGDDTYNTHNHWKDGKKQRLEDQLNDFIVGLYDEYKVRKDRKIYWEREKLAEQERCRRQEELQEKLEIERNKIQKLERDALNWQKSQIIRAYTEASKKAYIDKNGEIKPGNEFEQWVTWANQHVDRLNPIR